MVNEARKAELEALGIDDLESVCEEAGIDVTCFTKAELIEQLVKAEEPAEPAEEPGEGTGEGGEGTGEGGEGPPEPGED